MTDLRSDLERLRHKWNASVGEWHRRSMEALNSGHIQGADAFEHRANGILQCVKDLTDLLRALGIKKIEGDQGVAHVDSTSQPAVGATGGKD